MVSSYRNCIVFQARFVDLNTPYQAQKHTGDEISLSTAGYTSALWTSTSIQTSKNMCSKHKIPSKYPPVIQSNIGWKSPLSYTSTIYQKNVDVLCHSMAMLFLSWRAKGTLFKSLNPGILDQADQGNIGKLTICFLPRGREISIPSHYTKWFI